eukprot:3023207-Alexandrium_andersonii.AAC.1
MSASLVGSEMCIRDRRTGRPPRAGTGSGGSASRCHPRRSTTSGRCAWTVSYTHLTLPTICSV